MCPAGTSDSQGFIPTMDEVRKTKGRADIYSNEK